MNVKLIGKGKKVHKICSVWDDDWKNYDTGELVKNKVYDTFCGQQGIISNKPSKRYPNDFLVDDPVDCKTCLKLTKSGEVSNA